MKKVILSLLFICSIACFASAQHVRLNAYSAYLFNDNVDSYYDQGNYYNGSIKGGYQWGFGFEFMASSTKGIEMKYLRQDTHAPMSYYKNGAQNKVLDLGINYILLGGSNYFKVHGGKVEPYAGLGMGVAIIDIKNQEPNTPTTQTKFAWNLKLGSNIWLSEKVGLKLQADLLSAVQAVGGGFYFGTGGSGAGVSTYSSMLQFGLGGGLTFKLGK